MKKLPVFVILLALLLASSTFAGIKLDENDMLGNASGVEPDNNIFMDGDDSDWANVPYAVENWIDGVEGLYPEEVGAIVTDNVDIKSVKAVVNGNTLFWYLQFHGGPAMPNNAYQGKEYNGVPINRSRGHFHVLLDLDNNIETGWKTDWYESHYTTVGFLESQAFPGSDPIGAELWAEINVKYYYTAPHPDSGGIKNSGVDDLSYQLDDWSEYDGVSDNELTFPVLALAVPEPDSGKVMAWQGTVKNEESGDEILNADVLHDWYAGHGFGYDFVEVGTEIGAARDYFQRKNGASYFNEGDVIGVCGFSETPADGWGVDITTRGEFVCTAVPARPSSMTMDGDDSDWAAVPFAVENWVDGTEGLYPEEVGAIVTDNVDIKDVKAVINLDEDVMYWMLRFYGGPAMPNNAYQGKEYNGVPIDRSRGYYHVLLDLDNNIETGWKSDWYESHYTTVGFLESQAYPDAAPLGTEVWAELGIKYYYTAPHPDSGGIKNSGVDGIDLWFDDWSEYDGVSDNELVFGVAEFSVSEPDSARALQHDGMMPNSGSEDPSMITGVPEYFGHAWGFDFVEVGHAVSPIRTYFMNKTGQEFLKEGDIIGIAGFTETPADGWGVDITTRGEVVVGAGTAVDDRVALVDDYKLGDNYPNPFNPTTNIDYRIPVTSNVSIIVYNTLGQAVRTLLDRTMQSGTHLAVWDGRDNAGQSLSSGIYYYSIKADDFSQTKKMMLVK